MTKPKQARSGEDRRGSDRRRGHNKAYSGPERRKGDRRYAKRRGADKGWDRRRAFRAEQVRKRVQAALKLREKYRSKASAFSKERQEQAKGDLEEELNLQAQERKRDLDRLAKGLAFNYGLDPSIPTKTILSLWQEKLKQAKNKVNRKQKIIQEQIEQEVDVEKNKDNTVKQAHADLLTRQRDMLPLWQEKIKSVQAQLKRKQELNEKQEEKRKKRQEKYLQINKNNKGLTF